MKSVHNTMSLGLLTSMDNVAKDYPEMVNNIILIREAVKADLTN